jgi:hypothetical protein
VKRFKKLLSGQNALAIKIIILKHEMNFLKLMVNELQKPKQAYDGHNIQKLYD